MLEGLIDGDFRLALPNDPQSNPETLINILNNVLGEFFFKQIPIYCRKNMIYMFEMKFLPLFINVFEGSTSAGNPKNVSLWNTSTAQENRVG